MATTNIIETRYVRLLSYENAIKVIDWATARNDNSYAYITVGGVGVQIPDESVQDFITFLDSLTKNYEISGEHPTKTEAKIVKQLKENGKI